MIIFAFGIISVCLFVLCILNCAKKVQKESMTDIDFSKEKEYYREFKKNI